MVFETKTICGFGYCLVTDKSAPLSVLSTIIVNRSAAPELEDDALSAAVILISKAKP